MGRVLLRHCLESIHPRIRQVAISSGDGQLVGNTLEILDQPQAKHGGNGPQLAQLQGTHGLVSGDKGAERPGVDLRIDVRNQFGHDVVNPGQPGGSPGQEARQLPAVAPGQVPPGHLDLFLDQIEVVEKPLRGRGYAPAGTYGQGGAMEGSEILLVSVQSRQQPVGAAQRDDPVALRQGAGVARELFDAEQLGPQGRIDRVWTRTGLPRPPGLPA